MAQDGTFFRRESLIMVGALATAGIFAAAGLPRSACAAFPEKATRIVVPAQKGSGMDLVARIIQHYLKNHPAVPGTNTVVLNMPGDDGVHATRIIKDADPDGDTIGLWHEGLVTSAAMGIAEFGYDAFDLLGATGYCDLGIGVSIASPYQSFEALLDAAGATPYSVRCATEFGLPVHFLPLMLGEAEKVDFRFVEVGAPGQRFASVFAMHTDFAVFDALAFEKWAKRFLKPVVMFSEQRLPHLPVVPTARELGVDIVARSSNIWLAPRGMPQAVKDNLVAALRAATGDKAVTAQLDRLGITADFVEPAVLRRDLARWKRAVTPLVARARGGQI